MALLLEVTSPHAASMGASARRVLGETELKIGRDPGNDWVFPQEYVSRRQAIIRCVNGMYFLEQVGNCLLAINDAARPLERNRIARLSAGDRILLDDIEISVSEVDPLLVPHPAASFVAPAAEPPREPLGAAGPYTPASDPLAAFGLPPAAAGASVDPLELLGISVTGAHPARINPSPPVPSILDEALPVSPKAAPPAAGSGLLQDDWFVAKPPPIAAPRPALRPAERVATPPEPTPSAASARSMPSAAGSRTAAGMERIAPPERPVGAAGAAATADSAAADPGGVLKELLRGAGLDPTQAVISPGIAHQLGQVLRIVVEGTMQVLQARNEIRREFRLPTTQVARKDNNPLKFSADASDALHKLLVQRSPAYLDTVSSFADAFDDIRVHQLAMLESLRAAFNYMLGRFDPQLLAQQFEQGDARVVRGLGGRTRLWESFVARYADLIADRDFAFRRLFGEEFGKAYEQNLGRHKRMIKDGGSER